MTQTFLRSEATPPPQNTSPVRRSLWLDIRRGRTRAPQRPITGGRFLIGAGSNCDLQLGGHDIPILHSILHVEDDTVAIECLIPHPELKVNGQPCREATLSDGDTFEIGCFAFELTVGRGGRQSGAPHQRGPHFDPPDLDWNDDEDLESLTASQLVDRIDHERHLLERQERGRRQGADALLQAAGMTAASTSPAHDPAGPLEDVTAEDVLRELQGLVHDLQLRTQQILQRERDATVRNEQVQSAQQKLLQQIERVMAQLDASPDGESLHRASA